jgi:hypothetical protein
VGRGLISLGETTKELRARYDGYGQLMKKLAVDVKRDAEVPYEIRSQLAAALVRKMRTDPHTQTALMALLLGERTSGAAEQLSQAIARLTQDIVTWPEGFTPSDFGDIVGRHAFDSAVRVKASDREALQITAKDTREQLNKLGQKIQEISRARYPSLEESVDTQCNARARRGRELAGRGWLYSYLEERSRRWDSGYVWLNAAAGMGKTAIAEALAGRYQCPAYFFSQAAGRTRPDRCLNHLCAELILRFGLPYDRLPDGAGESAGFLSALLTEAAGLQTPVWLVIDALDEAESSAHGVSLPLPEECL